MKKRFPFFCAAALAAGLMNAGNGKSSHSVTATASPTVVKIERFTYSPNSVTVPVGTAVVWINHDIVPHDVVSDDKSFKSKLLERDEQFSYTFSKPGTYRYLCSIHPKMTADVVVK